MIKWLIAEPQELWYQLAPGHAFNSLTRPRSWFQLAPGHGTVSYYYIKWQDITALASATAAFYFSPTDSVQQTQLNLPA
jgi:hypothetical protein